MKALLGYRSFLAKARAGEWAAASDNRIYFVRYARETIDFWRSAEAMEKNLADLLPADEIAEALPRDFPERRTALSSRPLTSPDSFCFSDASRALSISATASFSRQPIREFSERCSKSFRRRPRQSRSSRAPIPAFL